MADKLYRLVISHRLDSGAERAQNVYHTLADDGFTTAQVAAQCEDPIADYWTALRPAVADSTSLEFARVYLLDPTDSSVIESADVPVPDTGGTGGANSLPTECAGVVTLRGDLAGARHRGRVYMPPTVDTGITGSGRFTTDVQDIYLDAVGSLLRGLLDATTPGQTPSIWSRAGLMSTPITSIDVGNVVDVQRRRREQLVETRRTASIP